MAVEITGQDRVRFARQLQAHRDGYAVSDAEYAERILGVSLNTFKRCINAQGHPRLAFKRNTFIMLFQRTGLDPARFGLSAALPTREMRFGGYGQADFPHLAGRYLIYRRSFLTALNIVRGVLDIAWDEPQQCYGFVETLAYETDSGNAYEAVNKGDIHIQAQRNLMFLLACQAGAVRMIMLQIPEAPEGGRTAPSIKTRGALLTYGNPKDFYQPIVSAVVVEKRLEKTSGDVRKLCGTLRPGQPEFAAKCAELRHAEEHAVVMTPLLFARAAPAKE